MLDLRLSASFAALQWLMIVHVSALVLILMATEQQQVSVILAAGVGGNWLWLRRHPIFGFGPKALRQILWSREQGWQIARANGVLAEARLLPSSTVLPGLVVLHFATERGRHRRAVLSADLSEDLFRRLRVRVLDEQAATAA